MYKEEVARGVRISKIRPQKLEFLPGATLEDILNKGREAFFSELDPPLSSLHLADSSGNVVDAESDDWTVGKYFEENGYQPSRHKLYIMYREPTVS